MDKEGLKGNLKLALFGVGCTNEYAEKGSEAVLAIILNEKRLAKKELFDNIDEDIIKDIEMRIRQIQDYSKVTKDEERLRQQKNRIRTLEIIKGDIIKIKLRHLPTLPKGKAT